MRRGEPDELRHVAVRDYLRGHPDEVVRYAAVKPEIGPLTPRIGSRTSRGRARIVEALEERALGWVRMGARRRRLSHGFYARLHLGDALFDVGLQRLERAELLPAAGDERGVVVASLPGRR